MDNFKWSYLRNGIFDPLIWYRASRGHLCDSTAFLFIIAVVTGRFSFRCSRRTQLPHFGATCWWVCVSVCVSTCCQLWC